MDSFATVHPRTLFLRPHLKNPIITTQSYRAAHLILGLVKFTSGHLNQTKCSLWQQNITASGTFILKIPADMIIRLCSSIQYSLSLRDEQFLWVTALLYCRTSVENKNFASVAFSVFRCRSFKLPLIYFHFSGCTFWEKKILKRC